MKARLVARNAAERYNQAQKYAKDLRLPEGYPRPQPTSVWPNENVALLERYQAWLVEGGASPWVVKQLYIPVAGYALGLALKSYRELDIQADLEPALAYVKAKQTSAEWLSMSRCALEKFRQFLRQERGVVEVNFPPDEDSYPADLPAWVGGPLLRWLHLRQRNWRPARRQQFALRFWSSHARLWRWLLAHYPIHSLADVTRAQIMAYADARLAQGLAVTTVNQDILAVHGFLLYLQEQDVPVPQALLKLKPLKQPDRLPRFLTAEQVQKVQDDLEGRVTEAATVVQKRDALLDRAAFYLMWHGGLRLGEVEELHLDNLDLSGRKLMVRQGKGLKDRTVYLTDTAVAAVQAYLAHRGQGPTSHVFLYRNEPLSKDLVRYRITSAGQRSGVKVTPHQLRHTYATQLLNAGCKITSIQKLLGHQRLNSTMTYARVHDRTVAKDYYRAMEQVEQEPMGTAGPESAYPGLARLKALLAALDTAPLTPRQEDALQKLRQLFGLTRVEGQPSPPLSQPLLSG